MSGVLFTLWIASSLEVLIYRTVSACRGWGFVSLAGGSSVLLTGLPEVLWPGLARWDIHTIKISMGPLSNALALFYLGLWSSLRQDDRLVEGISHIGSWFLLLLVVLLAVGGLNHVDDHGLLLLAMVVSFLGCVMATIVAVRGMTLGDPLAGWMVLACVFLAVLLGGLYSESLDSSASLAACVLTAASVVGHFLIVIWLTLARNRETRRLKRETSGLLPSTDSAGLAQGARLLELMEEALWRSNRMRRPCLVAAIAVPNLQLSHAEHAQAIHANVLGVLTARIRRIVGFRNVLGLYNERCFLLAVSAVQDPKRSDLMVERIFTHLCAPVITRQDQTLHEFIPEVGVGVVEIVPGKRSTPLFNVVRQAERLALQASTLPERVLRSVPEAGDHSFQSR